VEEPPILRLTQLVGAPSGVLGVNANEEVRRSVIPPVNRFLPPAEYLNDTVKALPPDEGIRYRVIANVGLYRFLNEFAHGTFSFHKGGRVPIVAEQMF